MPSCGRGPAWGVVGSSAPGSYLTPPVVLRDGDVVRARPAGRRQAVELGGQVGEVAVQVQVLGVLPSACPAIVASTLKTEATPKQGSVGTHAVIVSEGRAGLAESWGQRQWFLWLCVMNLGARRPLASSAISLAPLAGLLATCNLRASHCLLPLPGVPPNPHTLLVPHPVGQGAPNLQLAHSFCSTAHITFVTHQ